jgi:hypothetical protein
MTLYKQCLYIQLKSNDKYWLISNGGIFKTLGILHYAVKELFVVSVDCSKILWDDRRLKQMHACSN